MALVMAPQATDHVFATLDISFVPGEASATRMTDCGLDAVSAAVPAARCLPLLAALARGATAVVVLAYGEKNHVRVTVTPWQ
jgi:hypothetical protein